MSWLIKSPEQKVQQYIREQKNYGIDGSYKKRYRFTLEQTQCIAPGCGYRNIVKGVFDCGLRHINPDTYTQKWSIEMRDLEFDRNPQAQPEMYFLFAFPYRMDIMIDAAGRVTQGNTWVNYADGWWKKYKKEIKEWIGDTDRAKNLHNELYGNMDKAYAVELLNNNPLVVALGNVVALNYKLNNEPDTAGEFGERYTAELIKTNYFGEDLSLPLKTTWLKKETDDANTEEWIRLGGLLTEKYPEEDFRRMMRQVTGIFNLEVPLRVDFSEFYRLEKPYEGFRQIVSCGLHTQTLIKDVWFKYEDLEMIEDGKGVVYG